MRTPPRMAFWLLDRLGPQTESLSGDLLEEFHSGRSGLWFWRQTVVAVALETRRTLSHHPVLILRGVLVGWLSVQVFYLVAGRLLTRTLGDWLLDRFIFMFGSAEFPVMFPMLWAVNLRRWPAMWLGNLIAGWMVVRLHREHAGPILISCVLALALLHTYAAAAFWMRPRMHEITYPALTWAELMLPPVIVLAGGILALPSRSTRRSLATG
jgi:hypothetical protein